MLKWGSFIKEKDGEWDGLNNAAIYSFNSNIINSLVREMFQNSIDARDKDLPIEPATNRIPPLHIKINYKELNQEEFPDFDGFYNIFKKIAESDPNKLHNKFFNNGYAALGDKKKIPFFIYEDFNTMGLEGRDNNPGMSFNACVVSEGVSVKSDTTAGGSFGIGKNAIYGLSKLRTVFYTSVNKNYEYIFQGKAKLASYYDDNKKTRDNKIYCGINNNFESVRNLNAIPEPFKKIFHRDKPGLSQFAVCPVENDNWTKEFTKAILRNYWLLLEKGELVVELFEQDIIKYSLSKDNLEQLFKEFFNPDTYEQESVLPEGNPYEFYSCYKSGTCVTNNNFPYLKKVRFYFKELENKNTNLIAYLRNNMIVFTDSVWGFGSIGYCGLFLCDDKTGNEILRAMEPPTHDSFDKDRLHEKLEGYNVKDGQLILNNIKNLVKGSLQEIMDKYTKPAEDIKWLDDLLTSLIGSSGNGTKARLNEKSERETTEKIGKNISKIISFKSLTRNTIVNDESGEIEGIGGGTGKGNGGGPGDGRGSNGKGKGSGGGPSGNNPSKKTKIKSRIFRTNNSKQINDKAYYVYKIILEADKDISATDFLLSQQGDSGNVAMFEIGDVREAMGRQIQFQSELNKESEVTAYRLKNIQVPNIIEVWVNEPYKSSFKIVKS